MAELKSVAKDTAIYGLSSIIGKFLNYLLVPLYTAKMTVESGGYGIVTNIYAYVALLMVILTFGMETTLFRFANKEGENPQTVYGTTLTMVGSLSLLFALLVLAFLHPIASGIGYADHPEYVGIMAITVALDAFQAIPFAWLRYQHRPIKFFALKMLFIVLNITLNILYFVVLPALYVRHAWVGAIYDPSVGPGYAFILNLVCTSFITFFFLKEERLFYAMVTAVFPEHYHDNITRALDSVTVLLARYFTGILSESLLLTVAVSLVMMAFGMKAADAGFIGLIMGVMNVVPYAGPLIGGIVSVFVGIVSPIEGMGVGHTVFIIVGSLLIIKGMDDFILQPALYSARVKAHPLEIFLVILIAGSLAGILGMLLAIPSYTVIRVFAKEFFSQFRLVRKLTEKI